LRELEKMPREPTLRSFQAWAASRPELPAGQRRRTWIMAGAKCTCLDPLALRLLAGSPQPVTLEELLRGVDRAQAERLVRYFKKLAGHGLMSLSPAAPVDAAV
jgi:hypothetical protein